MDCWSLGSYPLHLPLCVPVHFRQPGSSNVWPWSVPTAWLHQFLTTVYTVFVPLVLPYIFCLPTVAVAIDPLEHVWTFGLKSFNNPTLWVCPIIPEIYMSSSCHHHTLNNTFYLMSVNSYQKAEGSRDVAQNQADRLGRWLGYRGSNPTQSPP